MNEIVTAVSDRELVPNEENAVGDLVRNDALVEKLDAHTDDELTSIIARARQILAARDDERKKQAVTAIQRLAKEHGLDIAVKKPARKRGRPPKQKRNF